MSMPETVQLLNGHGENMNTDTPNRPSDTIATNMANQHSGNQGDKSKTGESGYLCLQELQIRRGIHMIFSYFSIKPYVVCSH